MSQKSFDVKRMEKERKQLLIQVNYWIKKEQFDEAFKLFDQIKADNLYNFQSKIEHAKLLFKVGLKDKNEIMVDEAIDLLNQLKKQDTSHKLFLTVEKELSKIHKTLYTLGEFDRKAVVKAEFLNQEKNYNPKTWFTLGSNFSTKKSPQFAIDMYKKAIEHAPNFIEAYFRIAYIFQYNLKKNDEAVYYYSKIVSMSPEDATFATPSHNAQIIQKACNHLAIIYFNMRNYDGILKLFERAMELNGLSGIKRLETLRDLVRYAFKCSLKLGDDAYINRLYKVAEEHGISLEIKEYKEKMVG